MLGDMADQFVIAHRQEAKTTDRERFRSHRARMGKAGYTLIVDEGGTFERYQDLRQSYATSLAALGRRLQNGVDERTADDEDSEPQR